LGQLLFEVTHGPEVSNVFVEVVEPPIQEIGNFGDGSFGLGDPVDEFYEVRGREGLQVVSPQAEPGLFDVEFLENVKVTRSGRMDFDLAEIEEVKFAGERALGAPGSFGNGFDDAILMSAPVHDETGLGEGRPANQCAAGFHGLSKLIEFPLNITKRKFEFFHICENAYGSHERGIASDRYGLFKGTAQ